MRLPVHIGIERKTLLARLLCRGRVTGLTLRADGQIEVLHADGARLEGDVEGATTVFASLIVLRLRVCGRPAAIVLPRSATGAEDHRRLRVWLRCRAAAGLSASA